MGRHSLFNKQQVIANALDLFWSRGFGASSLKHLEEVTDMHPGSLYYHFQSKEQLYMAALEYYLEWYLRQRIEKHLIYNNSAIGLRRFFTVGYRNSEDNRFRNCCFVVVVSNDLHLLPEAATLLVQDSLEVIRQGFTCHLEQQNSSMPEDQVTAIASQLTNLYLGIQLQARITPNQHRLDQQVKQSLNRIIQADNTCG